MARQSLGLALLALVGCHDDPDYEGAFDEPIAAAVLPTAQGPFTEPIALVANAHGGAIAPLALKQGRFLATAPTASFLRTHWLPTGGARVLSSVAIWAPEPFEVHAFAGDRAYGQLVEVPWITGFDEQKLDGQTRRLPREAGPSWNEVVCYLTGGTTWDGTGDCPGQVAGDMLADVELKHGYTTTETWTLTWSEQHAGWIVEGSRSGRQPDIAFNDKRYKSTIRRVGFTVKAKAGALADGDQLVFATDTGLIEHDVGGTPLALAMAPDHSAMAMVVHDPSLEASVLRWFDPNTAAVTDVPLAAGSIPTRMEWSDDGQTLWVADAGEPTAWEVALGQATAIAHPLPFPILDIAPMSDDIDRLFVVSDDGREVWVFDAATDLPIDLNPTVEGVQGMFLGAAVTGIAPIRTTYRYPQTREAHRETRRTGRGVAIALASERVVFMEERSGCLVQDGLGPRTVPPSSVSSVQGDVSPNFSVTGGPVMVRNAHNDRHVQVNACAGIARDEAWTLRYDGAVGAWRVRSSIWGDHDGVAYEDQRYVSDNGEISFTIRSGPLPSQDGWEFAFGVDQGALTATGDGDGDGLREAILGPPGDPVSFHYLAGREEQTEIDWRDGTIGTVDGKTDRAYVIVPSTGADNVARINPETAEVELRWD